MRVSGVFLVVLIFGHLFVNLMVGDGIQAIDFGFVAGKLANPFWQWWDFFLLVARADPRRQRHAHDRERLRHDGARPQGARGARSGSPWAS